jgi:hypothetical protein
MIFVISIKRTFRKVMSEKWPEEKSSSLRPKYQTFYFVGASRAIYFCDRYDGTSNWLKYEKNRSGRKKGIRLWSVGKYQCWLLVVNTHILSKLKYTSSNIAESNVSSKRLVARVGEYDIRDQHWKRFKKSHIRKVAWRKKFELEAKVRTFFKVFRLFLYYCLLC